MSETIHQETSNAEKYARGPGLETRLLDRFRRRLASELAELEPNSILDAGCGEGNVAQWLREDLPGVALAGTDGRAEALEEFRARNPGVPATQADLYSLPFGDGEFDVVLAVEVLEHLDRPGDAVRELARVSSRRLVLTVPHEPFFRAGNLSRGRYVRRLGSTPGHLNTWSRRGFTKTVAAEADVVRWWGAFPWQAVTARRGRA